MNRKCISLFVLLATFLFLGVFASAYRLLPIAKATYVEGTITQNTVWTLVDSPFIVSDNITVNPGATLTIEPGVQVMFGDTFSLLVNGGIIADGTNDKMIQFTSGDVNASAGAWGTIQINGNLQSSITNCIVEYGQNGITLTGGSLNLQNDNIEYNLNGTMVNSGSITIQNDEIINNTLDGINIAGGAEATVKTMC